MEENDWGTHIWRGVEENAKQCSWMRKQHVLPMNPCVRIIFKSKQLIIWAIIRSTTLLTSLLCGGWSFTLQVTLFCMCSIFFLAKSFKSFIQICRPQCRVTINWKFFMMASIEGIYQLLIVSYVFASGRDLVTPSRGSSESTVHPWRSRQLMHRLRSHKSTSSWILGSLEFFWGQGHLPAGTTVCCT